MQIELCLFSIPKICLSDNSLRIELCANYYEGGTTPSTSSFTQIRKSLSNQIYVMIRPRGGDFYYSDAEFDLMKDEISYFKVNGAADTTMNDTIGSSTCTIFTNEALTRTPSGR